MPRIEPDDPPDATASVLRERIYGGIACLSTLLVLTRHVDGVESAWTAFADVAIATGALYAASLLADYVSHVAAHGHAPRGAEAAATLRASGQILQASAVPLLLLALAGIGRIRLEGALRAGVWVSVVTLGLFALLAARRTMLPWWQRTLLVAALLGLGALVVALKTLAH
ncbi:MAG: hypothetical protein AB7J32_04110 [Pseudonocardia sp.]